MDGRFGLPKESRAVEDRFRADDRREAQGATRRPGAQGESVVGQARGGGQDARRLSGTCGQGAYDLRGAGSKAQRDRTNSAGGPKRATNTRSTTSRDTRP